MPGFIKVCGITTPDDAERALVAGADAIGVNLWPKSPRGVSLAVAQRIAAIVRGRAQLVAVTVDLTRRALDDLLRSLDPDLVQLHGDEPDDLVAELGERCFKAVGLASSSDVLRALSVPGAKVLVDAKDVLHKGGTGRRADPALVAAVCRARPTIVAGGLSPRNVAEVIGSCLPFGVDVASGVEYAPGRKDEAALVEFVRCARRAFSGLV